MFWAPILVAALLIHLVCFVNPPQSIGIEYASPLPRLLGLSALAVLIGDGIELLIATALAIRLTAFTCTGTGLGSIRLPHLGRPSPLPCWPKRHSLRNGMLAGLGHFRTAPPLRRGSSHLLSDHQE